MSRVPSAFHLSKCCRRLLYWLNLCDFSTDIVAIQCWKGIKWCNGHLGMLSVRPNRKNDSSGGKDWTLHNSGGWAHGYYCTQGRRPYVRVLDLLISFRTAEHLAKSIIWHQMEDMFHYYQMQKTKFNWFGIYDGHAGTRAAQVNLVLCFQSSPIRVTKSLHLSVALRQFSTNSRSVNIFNRLKVFPISTKMW